VSYANFALAPRNLFLVAIGYPIAVCDKCEYVDRGSLPWHVGVIPFLECDTRTIGRKSGGCVEVGSRGDGRQRLGLCIDDYESVDHCGRVIVRVVLEYGSKEMSVNWMKVKVGISERLFRCATTDGSACSESWGENLNAHQELPHSVLIHF
jgi:hypothetical protein